MTLLELVQRFARRTGIPVPTTVYNNSDSGIAQIQGLLEEICIDAASRGFWESLVTEATWTSIAVESQGPIVNLAAGFRYILNKTIWDRTQQLPIYGPLSPIEWQGVKSMVVSGPQYQWRLRGGFLLINPVMPAGHSMAFEYVSNNWEVDVGGVSHAAFTADTSTLRLPDDVMLAGLRYKWKLEKGLDYTEDFALYERMINDSLFRSGGAKDIHMDDEAQGPSPGVYVPWGNWLQP
jgi:hypothetical protein